MAPGLLGDQTLLATFEWLDTLAIQAWTVWFVYKHRVTATLELSAPTTPPAPKPDSTFIPLRDLAVAAAILHALNLAAGLECVL